MPTYVTLLKWTDQGVQDVKNMPARFEAAKQLTPHQNSNFRANWMIRGSAALSIRPKRAVTLAVA